MMMSMRKQSSRVHSLITLLVVVSLCAFTCLIYFYAHLHVLANGRILVHSHALPKGEKSGTHTHSNLELFILDQQFEMKTVTFVAFLLYLFCFVLVLLFSSRPQLAAQTSSAIFFRRAPPTTLK